MAQSQAPDVCKVPSPAGPVPTPFVNVFQLNVANPGTVCQKVFINGAMALNIQTKFMTSNGDEAGVAGGVVSNMIVGPGSFMPACGSVKVMLSGKPAVMMGAQTFHNGDASFNTMGSCPLGAQTKVMIGS
jgi:hypothetical protein